MRAASRTIARVLRSAPVGSSPTPSPFICRNCLSRYYSSSASTATPPLPEPGPPPPLPPPSSGYAALGSRRLISVSGPDAAKYLQGVITSSIVTPDKQARPAGFYSAFLNAQGRVLHDVFIYPDRLTQNGRLAEIGSSFLIEVDAAEVERLARHIKRYKLRAKFDVRTLEADEATVWHAWDDSGRLFAHTSNIEDAGGDMLTMRDTRSPTLGSRLLRLGGASEEGSLLSAAPWIEELGLSRTPEASYRVRRYLHGVAEGQSEILREQALPPESNMDLADAIDWHKGCYVGQELTIRTRHRGVVRKRILPCVLYSEDSPSAPDRLEYHPRPQHEETPEGSTPANPAGLSTTTPPPPSAELIPPETSVGRVGKRGRSAGKWLSGVGNVGLALCRLEIMTDLALPGDGAAAAVQDPASEFMMVTELDENGGSGRAVKLKAFVPDWLRDGLTAQDQSRGQGRVQR